MSKKDIGIKSTKTKDNHDWIQSSLNNFIGLNEKLVKYYNEDSDNDELSNLEEIKSNIKLEKLEEERIQELFEKYRMKTGNIKKEDLISDDEKKELMKGLLWCLKYVKLNDYRIGQKEAIHKLVCDRRDVILILPTGGGKSLTYQLPSILREYQKQIKEIPSLSKGMVTIVISPLIALIEDQINSLKKWGIKSNGLSSTIVQKNDKNQSINKALEELYADLEKNIPTNSIIYVTPESFGTQKVLNCLYKLYINRNLYCFAIDEAHCISEWGHDFRIAYRRLNQIKNIFRDIPVLACTATASPKVQKDIKNVLNLNDPFISINSFNRPNIHYTVYNIDDNDYFSNLNQEEIILYSVLYMNHYFKNLYNNEVIIGIIYVNTRKMSENLSIYLNNNGIISKSYHAGLSLKVRTQIQNDWLNNKIQVLVGTIAFGMGVHKPNVRFVIHSSIPESIDSYYQQSGRAGRDSQYSRALLFFSKKDITSLKCIKRKSLQYLFMKSQLKAQQSFDKFQNNLQSMIEFTRCNISEYQSDYEYYSSQSLNSNNNNYKTQDPIDYQLNLNKDGQCRRKYLLNYFGEKLSITQKESNKKCCDVCDSKYNKNVLKDSFINYIAINFINSKYSNQTNKKSFKNGFVQQDSSKNKFSYEYEKGYKDNMYSCDQNNCFNAFKSAKSLFKHDESNSSNFKTASSTNNELKKKGLNYIERLKILEKQELEQDEDSNSKFNSIMNSFKRKKVN